MVAWGSDDSGGDTYELTTELQDVRRWVFQMFMRMAGLELRDLGLRGWDFSSPKP